MSHRVIATKKYRQAFCPPYTGLCIGRSRKPDLIRVKRDGRTETLTYHKTFWRKA